ncbi:hypothetical protein C1E24_11050 [Pseudoalteromonas phenolica]|uniref:Uncharacterized protein n=2 Tax=Pseudoalteromonas phenolica TaxID=161398 RepID=A0A5R9Q278_9GAMM|nr:hypothetical protein C1E24_11050 [Pseudoalteromonas phenolica]
MSDLAQWIVALLSGYFIAFGLLALIKPERVKTFLLAFAHSPKAHFTEMACRLVAGSALTLNAENMKWEFVFSVFGWVLIGTTLGLLVIPWQKHRQFAQRFVPPALKYLVLIAISSIGFSVLLFWASFG